MRNYDDENAGSKTLNWAVIVGAAMLAMLSFAAPIAMQTAQSDAPQKALVQTASHAAHA